MFKKMTRVVVAFLLLVTFTAGAAPAAPWSLAGDEGSPLAALWERIVSWLRAPELIAVWTEGCHIDPDGRCVGGATTGDEGSQMDPDG